LPRGLEGFEMALYRFGVFQFDSVTGELHKTGRHLRLRPQPAKVLEHLLGRPGELVSREELQRTVWPDGTFVHFNGGLNSCMKQIRAALGDRRSVPEYVETLVRRGFRFIAPVTVASPHEQTGPAEVAMVAGNIEFFLKVSVRKAGNRLRVTSTLIDARGFGQFNSIERRVRGPAGIAPA
jgi:DNA-binding winged helix-turn-helix (wHTH) protein